MTLPTYQSQYEKLIQAYFKDEIEPMNPFKCFCGVIANNNGMWLYQDKKESKEPYTLEEFRRVEAVFLFGINAIDIKFLTDGKYTDEGLFNGLLRGLEELKLIHLEHNELYV